MSSDDVFVEVVDGVEGPCLVINELRVAGPKPWGGGTVVQSWRVSRDQINEALMESKEETVT